MEAYDLNLGQIVRSAAGRDKGKFFLIVEIADNEFVKICDGERRKINISKRKKKRHLKKTNHVVYELKERLEKGQRISDAEIRRYLEDYRNNTLIENGGI